MFFSDGITPFDGATSRPASGKEYKVLVGRGARGLSLYYGKLGMTLWRTQARPHAHSRSARTTTFTHQVARTWPEHIPRPCVQPRRHGGPLHPQQCLRWSFVPRHQLPRLLQWLASRGCLKNPVPGGSGTLRAPCTIFMVLPGLSGKLYYSKEKGNISSSYIFRWEIEMGTWGDRKSVV